ncbi:hypothetical protein [Tsuneonella flava]|uniref:hypothetical protein n=1 Tax=Tsuneonella flava TaxID=2055955 RepID=UPI0012FFFF00|nr:hypothetical protein [Tsuneonella flava]
MVGKRPIITGVSKGIGGGFARPDAEAGADLAICSRAAHGTEGVPDERKPLNASILTAR